MNKNDKTNVMRLLDKAKIEYIPHFYDGEIVDGVGIAEALGEDVNCTFKTLVTVSDKGEHFVFVVPVAENLDLKKAAKTVGVKSIAMIKQKELLPLTGYIHGGCSPIGMKKRFKTVFHETAQNFEKIYFSAGKVGCQVEIETTKAIDYIGAFYGDIIV
ncbi:MAG: Cys-tRNA(Pro) deacylase [Ruminococcaceae bacterium]|nr:Cys-tRNA(Pro) deacylase [Oscillospiraceae bacterium]